MILASSWSIDRARVASRTRGASSHSHTTNSRQPSSAYWRSRSASRATLRRNFAFQKRRWVLGVVAWAQPWRCQKQPRTSTIARKRGRTTSGCPGSDFTWSRNRKPSRCSHERTNRSGPVSFDRIRPMIALRRSFETVSMARIIQQKPGFRKIGQSPGGDVSTLRRAGPFRSVACPIESLVASR